MDGTIQPQSYWSESARQQRRNQARVNSLIGNYIARGEQLDWLHLDVEGYDADLLKALEEPLPSFIIFENHPSHHKEELEYNEQQKKRIQTYLRDNGHEIVSSGVSCLVTLPHLFSIPL